MSGRAWRLLGKNEQAKTRRPFPLGPDLLLSHTTQSFLEDPLTSLGAPVLQQQIRLDIKVP